MRQHSPVTALLSIALALLGAACGGDDSSQTNVDAGHPNPGPDGSAPGMDAGPSADGSTPADTSTGTDTGPTPVDSGGSDVGTTGNDGSTAAGHLKTVFLIVMENNNWSDIKANAPYVNSLLALGAHAEQYFDNPKSAHPSEPNYLWLEGGDNFGISGNDNEPSTNHQATTQHLVTLLGTANISWTAYAENMIDGTCPITATADGLYAPKHTPMVFFDDIVGNPPSSTSAPCIAHIKPYSGFPAQLASNTNVARYNFITPNLCNDMHGVLGVCAASIKTGDDWLSVQVPEIMNSAAYKDNGVLFITWDESEQGEHPIGMIVLSPKAKVGYSNSTMYYHSSMLRTIQEIFDVTPLLRDAANQPDLSDMFTSFP